MTPSGDSSINIGRTTNTNARFIIGWTGDATTGNSFIDTAGGARPLALQESGGNVGIGTTNPENGKLMIATSGTGIQEVLNIRNNQAAAADVGAQLLFSGTTAGSISGRIASAWNGAADTDSYLSLYTRGSGTVAERMRITSTGNVGIGTTSPGNYKLNVKGTVNASAYVTNGTDYAEWMEKLNVGETISAGDVVGVFNGKHCRRGACGVHRAGDDEDRGVR
ncbi:MAG: hypothetical protein HYT73_02080 [Candidatus Aenigmarchaeota archaeon]|nr:hypothetical protein [Candidatus Aenigmarchaeota archaeon]